MSTPKFLAKDRHGGYLFRRVIPIAICHHFANKREIRHSLRTYHRGTALLRARQLAAQTDRLFEALAQSARKSAYPGEADRLNVKLAAELGKQSILLLGAQAEEVEKRQICREWGEGLWTDQLQVTQYDNSDKAGLRINFGELEERGGMCAEIGRENPPVRAALTSVSHAKSKKYSTISAIRPTAQSISDLWQTYRAEKRADQHWKSERIAAGFDAMLRIFIELVGNLRPSEIKKAACIKYKDELQNYPLGRFKGENAAIPLVELRAQTDKRLSLATRNGHMTAVSTFVDWLVMRDLIDGNPFTSAKLIPRRNERAEKRDSFTSDDLKLIFMQDRFRGAYKHNWQYWISLLALYTGARIEELAQLRDIDVMASSEELGAWLLNIDDRDDFTTKTASAIRVIPVHSKLIDLGFLGFVKTAGNGHLFPAPPTSDGKRGSKMSNDFSRLKTTLGFGKKKVFHSFRNTFIHALSRAGVGDSKISALVGHAQAGVTFRRYWTAHEEELNAAAMRINFDDVLAGVVRWDANRP